MEKTNPPKTKRRDVATLTAAVHGVSADYVRKVIRGDREHEGILTTYMEIVEQDNKLLSAVKKAVPF